ncbi:unnamed protein product, partial [Rotaria sordida]
LKKPKPRHRNRKNYIRSGSPNSNNTTPLQPVDNLQVPIVQPVQTASTERISTEDSNDTVILQSAAHLVTPVALPVQNGTTQPDIAENINDAVILQSIEDLVSPIALQIQEPSNEPGFTHIYSSISPVQLKSTSVHAIQRCDPRPDADSQTINNDFEKLQIEQLAMFSLPSPPPLRFSKQPTTTTQAHDYNIFNLIENNYHDAKNCEISFDDDHDEMDIVYDDNEIPDEQEPVWIMNIRAENAKILAEWNKEVDKWRSKSKKPLKRSGELKKNFLSVALSNILIKSFW